jgi:hypothetical protein
MEQEDAQVLAQLKKKKVRLKLELERVEIAIRAFEEIDENNIDPLDEIRFDEDIACNYKDELAIATLMYNPKSSYEKKIQFVLSKIGNGDAKEITEYITKIDKDIKDLQGLYERITYVSSRMSKTGKLNAVKSGKKNLYKLIDK